MNVEILVLTSSQESLSQSMTNAKNVYTCEMFDRGCEHVKNKQRKIAMSEDKICHKYKTNICNIFVRLPCPLIVGCCSL